MKKLILLLAFAGISANAGTYEDAKNRLYNAAQYVGGKVSDGAAYARDTAEGIVFWPYLAWRLYNADPRPLPRPMGPPPDVSLN